MSRPKWPSYVLESGLWKSTGFRDVPVRGIIDPGGELALDRSDYPVGWDSWPILYWLPPGSTYNTNGKPSQKSKTLTLNGSSDYRVICPEPFMDMSLVIDGGRNYVIFGLQCEWTSNASGFLPGRTPDYSGSAGSGNNCLRVNGRGGSWPLNSDPVFRCIEGMYIKGIWAWDGLEVECKSDRGDNATFMMQNFKVDQINVVLPTAGGHMGGDVIQNFRGYGRTIVRGADWNELHYQGWFYQPEFTSGAGMDPGNPTYWEFTKARVYGARNAVAQLIWDTMRSRNDIVRNWQDVWINVPSNSLGAQDNNVRPEDYAKINWQQTLPDRLAIPMRLAGINYPYMPVV